MEQKFPMFRKHVTGKSFYIILGENEYKEFQLVGRQIFTYDFKIQTYFDKLYMKSLLDAVYPFLTAEEHEFETLTTIK
jgi:hypothetical protein